MHMGLLLALLAAVPVPAIDSPITDVAGVLSEEKRAALSQLLVQHKTESGVQLALLLVRTSDGEPIEDYALRAAIAWGGGEKRKDDGALFVMAVDDRRMRLELGYGLESMVSDATAAEVLEELKPFLREGNYDGAAAYLVSRFHGLTSKGVEAPPVSPTAPAPSQPLLPSWTMDLLDMLNVPWILSLFAALFTGRALRRRFEWKEGVKLTDGLTLSVPQSIVASAVVVGVLTAIVGLLGFSFIVWWPMTIGLLVGAFALHDQGAENWLFYVGALGVGSVAMQMTWDAPLDRFLFGILLQAAISGVAIVFSNMEGGSGGSSDFSSRGVSWSHTSSFGSSSSSSRSSGFSSGSSFGSSRGSSSTSSSSSSSSSSSGGGGYRGGGGSFGGGGASSSW